MTEHRTRYITTEDEDRPDRFEVGMADVVGMNQQQAQMMYEIGQDIGRELYAGNLTRAGAVEVLERLVGLLESGRRRA